LHDEEENIYGIQGKKSQVKYFLSIIKSNDQSVLPEPQFVFDTIGCNDPTIKKYCGNVAYPDLDEDK
jgi:hypothetical protein